jgi:hypothetical protein
MALPKKVADTAEWRAEPRVRFAFVDIVTAYYFVNEIVDLDQRSIVPQLRTLAICCQRNFSAGFLDRLEQAAHAVEGPDGR